MRTLKMIRFARSLNGILLLIFLLPAASSLSQIAEGKDKFLGCILQSGTSIPRSWPTYWNQVTPENASKWGSAEPARDVYNWTDLDRDYAYAKRNGFPFRFHCLVWGKQQPGWIAALDSAEQIEEIEEWFNLAGERYPEADYVEVVNEAIEWAPYDYYPSYRNALGGAGATGWDWVIRAFEMARLAFPDSKLLLNEYQLFGGNKSMTTWLTIVNLLKERNLIDGVCEQGHFLESAGAAGLKNRLDQMAAAGLPIQITEFDLNFADDTQQLNKYKVIFPTLWEHPAVEGITLWGYIQGTMWRSDGWLLTSKGVERPALTWLKDYVANWTSAVSGPAEAAGPDGFRLGRNFPNPFNPSTRIAYELSVPGRMRLEVLDCSGRVLDVPFDGLKTAGLHHVEWTASDRSGRDVPAGVYVYRMTVTDSRGIRTQSGKMTVLK
jgi:endo-1,4-beta-xylanase